MKLSEVIARLEQIMKIEGDIEVHWGFEGIGGKFDRSMIHLRDGDIGHGEPPRLVILGDD